MSSRVQRISAAAPLHGLWVALAVLWLLRYRTEGDSALLVRGSRHAIDCVTSSVFTGCGAEVGHFPLIQYVLAAPVAALGFSDASILRWLAIVNATALVLAAFALVHAGRREAGWLGGWLMVATAVGSPLVVYGGSTFREPLSAALLVMFVAAVLSGVRPGVVFALAVLASITQETFPPFVLTLGVLAAWQPGSRRVRDLVPAVKAIAAGVLVGVVLNLAFNLFRHGGLSNSALMSDEFRVPRTSWRAALAVSLWVSPNAGLLWFWFVPVAVLVAVVVRGLVALARRPTHWWEWGPPLALGGVAGIHTVGLAFWWSPFGWYAWGPRLSFPLTAALALVALHLDRDWFVRLGRRLARRELVVLAGVAVAAALSLPNLAAAYDDEPYRKQFFGEGDERCPVAVGNPVSGGTTVEYFYECQLLHRAWGRRPLVLVERGAAALSREVFPLVVLAVLTLLAGAVPLRGANRTRPRSDSSAEAAGPSPVP